MIVPQRQTAVQNSYYTEVRSSVKRQRPSGLRHSSLAVAKAEQMQPKQKLGEMARKHYEASRIKGPVSSNSLANMRSTWSQYRVQVRLDTQLAVDIRLV